jgi:hypothetical protein
MTTGAQYKKELVAGDSWPSATRLLSRDVYDERPRARHKKPARAGRLNSEHSCRFLSDQSVDVLEGVKDTAACPGSAQETGD